MTPEELQKQCHAVALEMNSLLNESEWDLIQTFAQTLAESDARKLYDEQREQVLHLLGLDDLGDRQAYFSSLPVAKRNLVCFFARIAAFQAACVASAVDSATQAIEGLENPVVLLAESIERSVSVNKNYLGLF